MRKFKVQLIVSLEFDHEIEVEANSPLDVFEIAVQLAKDEFEPLLEDSRDCMSDAIGERPRLEFKTRSLDESFL